MPDHANRDQPRMTFRTEVARKLWHHAMEQFVDVRRFHDGIVRCLPEVGARLVELFTLRAVIEPVNSRAVRSLLGNMTEQAQDEVFDLQRESGLAMFFGVHIGNGYGFSVVGEDSALGDRAALD